MADSATPLSFPAVFRVRQRFPRPRVDDIEQTVCSELDRIGSGERIAAGQSVAVTAGSRGIANIPQILRSVVRYVRRHGGQPFLVPAMGSHGGGTVEGQMQVLEKLGITEAACECPIRASMDTEIVATAPQGFPIHFDRHARQADHVIVCGRIKPHTDFSGAVESGLMKMLLIGLGKHRGATVYHRAIFDRDFDEIVRAVAREVVASCHILCGLAILENAYDETAQIEAVPPDAFESREPQLLATARSWMPRLPFARSHVLLIDRMGKDISGTGFDTNVVDRKQSEVGGRRASHSYIAVRSLTAATAGNATGIGLAELCRTRVLEQMDMGKTRMNVITAGHLTGAKLPLDYRTDREMLEVALSVIGLTPPREARLMWIQDTLHLVELECSEAYYREARERDDLEVLSEPRPLPLGEDGNLPDDWWGEHETGR